MIQRLLIYPDKPKNSICADVRLFNDTLADVLEDMRDTMKEHNLSALSAIQIAYAYNIILLKEGDEYHEYINPRILKADGKFESTESSAYYPDLEITIPRYESIKVIYENRKGEMQNREITNRETAATFQRKMEFLGGGSFLDKLGRAKKEALLESYSTGKTLDTSINDSCPDFSPKDYFVSFTNKLLFFMILSLFMPLFNFSQETIATMHTYNKIAFPLVVILMIVFFFYAKLEATRFGQCSSCQVGNNIGVIVKRISLGAILLVASYFILI